MQRFLLVKASLFLSGRESESDARESARHTHRPIVVLRRILEKFLISFLLRMCRRKIFEKCRLIYVVIRAAALECESNLLTTQMMALQRERESLDLKFFRLVEKFDKKS